MQLRMALIASTLFAGAACGPPQAACTECPNVAGTYTLDVTAVPAEQSTCKELSAPGGTTEVELKQDKSTLTIGGAFHFTGTLFDNLSVTLQDNNVALTNTTVTASATIQGQFTGDEGHRVLKTSIRVTAHDNTSCHIDIPVVFTQKSAP